MAKIGSRTPRPISTDCNNNRLYSNWKRFIFVYFCLCLRYRLIKKIREKEHILDELTWKVTYTDQTLNFFNFFFSITFYSPLPEGILQPLIELSSLDNVTLVIHSALYSVVSIMSMRLFVHHWLNFCLRSRTIAMTTNVVMDTFPEREVTSIVGFSKLLTLLGQLETLYAELDTPTEQQQNTLLVIYIITLRHICM